MVLKEALNRTFAFWSPRGETSPDSLDSAYPYPPDISDHPEEKFLHITDRPYQAETRFGLGNDPPSKRKSHQAAAYELIDLLRENPQFTDPAFLETVPPHVHINTLRLLGMMLPVFDRSDMEAEGSLTDEQTAALEVMEQYIVAMKSTNGDRKTPHLMDPFDSARAAPEIPGWVFKKYMPPPNGREPAPIHKTFHFKDGSHAVYLEDQVVVTAPDGTRTVRPLNGKTTDNRI